MSALKKLFKKAHKYLAKARFESVQGLSLRANFITLAATVVFRLWIFAQLYEVTFKSSGATVLGGLRHEQVIWCLMFVQAFSNASRPYLGRLIEQDVKTGALVYDLCKPWSYALAHYFGALGRSLPVLGVNVLLGAAACLILVGPTTFSIEAVLAGLVLLFLGMSLDFFIGFTIGILALWSEDVSAFIWIYEKFKLVLGGAILPPALFSNWLREIAEVLPFGLQYYASAKILVQFSLGDFSRFVTWQLFWLVALGLLAEFTFRRGERYVSINGG